jgi:hypothetical protein
MGFFYNVASKKVVIHIICPEANTQTYELNKGPIEAQKMKNELQHFGLSNYSVLL